MILDLPMPPSANSMWVHAGQRHYLSKGYKEWGVTCIALGMLHGWHKHQVKGKFTAVIILNRSKARKGSDADNRIKPLLDLLQRLGVVENDKFCEKVSAEWGDAPDGCRVIVESVQ
jgi:crossover junction endodeoxyribonuclease RusA